MTKTDNQSIVQGIFEGNEAMETALFTRYRGSVTRLLEYLTHDHARAEDLAQDTLLIVLLKLRKGQVGCPEYLSSFVHQTARFCWLGWHRQNVRFDYRGDMNDELDDTAILQTLMQTERRESLTRLIESISVPRDREVLYRSYVCDEPKPAVCEALALTPIHFDRVISRAKARLRKKVQSRDAEALGLAVE